MACTERHEPLPKPKLVVPVEHVKFHGMQPDLTSQTKQNMYIHVFAKPLICEGAFVDMLHDITKLKLHT